ncbi:hypothetical protein [Agitococcus lubricus]|uniref:Uncharacterized protein n=1 Tax=Agitococcus lubricus TaxID=1077255 RepID=A0A2T5IZG7_9GAMM|nr:hypothetical protein [Agitococcus lubricus]PTQ89341.1 hypothetical protein C8N29_10774 [Agitococcus lubricus]
MPDNSTVAIHQTIQPKISSALLSIIPLLFFVLSPLLFISYYASEFFISVIIGSLVFVLFFYTINTHIINITITEKNITFGPIIGKIPTRVVQLSDIHSINILKYKDKKYQITLSTHHGKIYEINMKYYSETDKEMLLRYIQHQIKCPQREGETASLVMLMYCTFIIYGVAEIIENQILTTSHQSSSDLMFNLGVLLIIPISYVCHIMIKNNKASKLLFIFSPLIAINLTTLLTNLVYLYNEHYPLSSTQNIRLALKQTEGNYQDWQLSAAIQKTLLLENAILTTRINKDALAENFILKQGQYYNLTIQTGLLNDTFIVPHTIRAAN